MEVIDPSGFADASEWLAVESFGSEGGPSLDEGGVSLTGDVGESRSLDPDESFVRFFLRNPRFGIGARRFSFFQFQQRLEFCAPCPVVSRLQVRHTIGRSWTQQA